MSLARRIVTLAAPVALLSLGGCATGFQANVSRFQALPAPQGQSFVIQSADPRNQGGLEFSQYAQLVAQRLTAQGYQQASSPASATLAVTLDYGVDNGREKVVTTPGFGGPYWGGYGGFGGWGGWGWGRGWGRGFGGWGGWGYDPLFDGPDVRSYTVYTSYVDMTIKRTADGQNLFEGTAKARSRDDNLARLVPNLVQALFTNFPGRSGETVQITLPPPARTAQR